MKSKLVSIILWFGIVVATTAKEEVPLNSHLRVFRPLLEKTWRGTFTNSTPEKPVVDVQKWERALNG